MFKDMVKVIPAGSKGLARVEHYSVSPAESAFTSIRAIQHPEEFVDPGDYCRLYVGKALMMSDTPMERRSNFSVVRKATGNVLIAGLGVGLILVPILAKKEVKTVTVVEKYRDVIDLVSPPIRKVQGSKKLAVVEADIFEWVPPKGQKWDCIYFDIWPTVCEENLVEMEKLHRKFGRCKASSDSWMDSWKRGWLKYQMGRGARAGW